MNAQPTLPRSPSAGGHGDPGRGALRVRVHWCGVQGAAVRMAGKGRGGGSQRMVSRRM